MDDYNNLLEYYYNNNFVVCNFDEFDKKYKNNLDLPEKIVLLRHDIHHRDIQNAYKMNNLEKKIFGKNVATYFVQWNFIGSTDYEEEKERNYTKDYKEFINYCLKNKIHVQPHLSLYCHSFKKLYNRNNNNKKFLNSYCYCYINDNKNIINTTFLDDSINEMNYVFYDVIEPNNISIDIKCDKEFASDFNNFIDNIEKYIVNYIKLWKKEFNIIPTHFSAHGDGIELTKMLNPNVVGCLNVIEKHIKNANSASIYVNSCSNFKLHYKCDNSLKKNNIINSLYHDNNNQYELLVHPYVWSNNID